MLAFAMSGHGELLESTLGKTAINLSAYATRNGRRELWVTIVNKDRTHDAMIETTKLDGYASIEVFRLSAPSVESTDHVTLAGAEVSGKGKWSAGRPEKCSVKDGLISLRVPHASAALLRLRR